MTIVLVQALRLESWGVLVLYNEVRIGPSQITFHFRSLEKVFFVSILSKIFSFAGKLHLVKG